MARPPVRNDADMTASILRRLKLLERRRQGALGDRSIITEMATLDQAYRGWGPAKVKMPGGTLTTSPLDWIVPYDPNGPRTVRLVRSADEWLIAGQASDETIMLPYDDTKVDIYGQRAVDNAWNLRPRATKLALSGLVVLSGMLMSIGTLAGGTVIGVLPEGMRPPIKLIFPLEYGDSPRALYIRPTGEMVLSPGPAANSYISLDGIAFHPDGVGTWIDVGSGGSSFGANFGNWTDGTYTPCAFYKDPWGFVWFRGLVRVNVATTLDNTNIVALPAPYRANLEQHFRSTGQDTYAGLGAQTGDGLNWKSGSPGAVDQWISLAGALIVTTDALTLNPWKAIKAYNNGWGNYGASFPPGAYLRREDGLCMTKGLISAGTVNTRQTVMTQEEMWPTGGRIILSAISNQARARLDIHSARDTDPSGTFGPGALVGRSASNAWFSWDGLKWVP